MANYLSLLILLITPLLTFFIVFIKNKKLRLLITSLILLISLFAQYYVQYLNFDLFSFVVLFVSFIQVFNTARIVNLRYNYNTFKRVLKNGMTLSLSFLFLLLINNWLDYSSSKYLLSFTVFIMGAVGMILIFKNTSKINNSKIPLIDDSPTVSVLVPARNEDGQLADCIQSIIESDYPKLEILVLDDCSQDKSSEIIKSFAQKGVRFIQGETPGENWLAKNQAYETLSQSASGNWLFFMGVDVRLSKRTISTLMSEVLDKDLLMTGILPSTGNMGFKGIFCTLRYYWELILPFFIMRHPPIASTSWLIQDEALKSCGGFSAVSQSVLPERYFALHMKNKNKYRFYRNSKDLGTYTTKTLTDQLETSQRLLYPQLKKSISRLFVMTMLSVFIISQYILVFNSLLNKNYEFFTIALLSLLPTLASHFYASYLQGIQYKITRSLLLPYLLIQELVCAYISAYRYEFSEVIWKGRNVCYPTLKVIPSLPKI